MGKLKNNKPTLESLDKRLSQLEKLTIENIVKVEANLNAKYIESIEKLTEFYKEFAGKIADTQDEKNKEHESLINHWIDKEGGKADADRDKHEQLRLHSYKHIKTVEDYVHLQAEVLKANTQIFSDIRDCLKTLSLSKIRTGKNTYNGTDN